MQAQALDYLKSYMKSPEVVGEGRLRVFFMNVYDAQLYTNEADFDRTKPFAIHIKYLRNISKEKIADRSLDEMAGQGIDDDEKLETWRREMLAVFPDVKKGTTLTGVFTENQTAVFYKNGKLSGEIKDTEFANAFFDIWLRDDTSAPDLRRNLLGLKR